MRNKKQFRRDASDLAKKLGVPYRLTKRFMANHLDGFELIVRHKSECKIKRDFLEYKATQARVLRQIVRQHNIPKGELQGWWRQAIPKNP